MKKPRGKLFVDSAVQGALVKRLVLHWIMFFCICVLGLFALECFLGDPSRSMGERAAAVWTKHAAVILILLALIPTFIYDTIKLSHRFAGPIFRLRTSIKKLAQGETVKPLKFREQDFWAELAEDFNQVASRVSGKKT